ncbi:MAG TPA: hypothetical protein VIE66_17070 [Methylocella sp.]
MAIYITQGRYTPDAVKGMVANPENREKAVAENGASWFPTRPYGVG